MAVMWPRQLPVDVKRNSLRSAECEVYSSLQSSLDDSFTVFYSRPWLGLKPDGEEIDGECDFVIAHPELGVLAVEVKGGGISYNPKLDEWTSKDRWGIRHKIKNPVNQARKSKYRILEKLQVCPGWNSRRIRILHAVIFPDSVRPPNDLGPDMPLRLFCFLDDFKNNLGPWIMTRMGEPADAGKKEQPMGQDGLRILEELLAHPFQLKMPLGRILEKYDMDIQILTTQQYHILRMIEGVNRAAIAGGAGTGKTVLALEEARRCAQRGIRTLYTCFNSPLADEVRRRAYPESNFEIYAFHDLCIRLISSSGIPCPAGFQNSLIYHDSYPDMLVSALCKLSFKGYGAIIIDEGQDFYASWWPALECLFSAKSGCLLRVFYDSNQRVYENVLRLPADVKLIPIRLTHNLRNTQKIHAISQQYYEGHPIDSLGPEGVSVEWIKCASHELVMKTLKKLIGNLVVNERIPAGDLAVLFADEKEIQNSGFRSGISGIPVTSCSEPAKDSAILDTVRRFKGLESKIVIIVIGGDLILSTELLYVATSRARTHLVIVGLSKDMETVRGS